MKPIVQIIMAFLLISCNQIDHRFTITGLTSNIADSTKIYLTDSPGSKLNDSSFVIQNRFQFKGSVDSLIQLTVHTEGYSEYIILWIDNSEITLDARKSNLWNGQVSGSQFQELNYQYNKMERYWKERVDSIKGILRKANENDSILIKNLSQIKASEEQNKHMAIAEFMRSNPDFSLNTFNITFLMFNQPKPLTVELFNVLSEETKNNMWGKSIRVYLDKSVDLKVGDNAVDFTMPDIMGNQISLSSFKGKYLLLEFWASWCGPCRKENPNLLTAYRKYNSKGFEILGVTLDEKKDIWESTITSDTLIWATVSDLKGILGEVPLTYKANYIPKNFLVDQEGKIIGIDIRGESLEEKLDSIFKN